MDKELVKKLALETNFKLKPQEHGDDDLHSYVYEFADKIEKQARLDELKRLFEIEGHEVVVIKSVQKLKDDINSTPLYFAISESDDDELLEIAEDFFKNATQVYSQSRIEEIEEKRGSYDNSMLEDENETGYLLNSHKNKDRLLNSVDGIKSGQTKNRDLIETK